MDHALSQVPLRALGGMPRLSEVAARLDETPNSCEEHRTSTKVSLCTPGGTTRLRKVAYACTKIEIPPKRVAGWTAP